jgi:hypothetical protein
MTADPVQPVRWVPIEDLEPGRECGLTEHQRAEALLMALSETILMETARVFAGEDWPRWYARHGGKVRYDGQRRACIPVASERIAWRAVVKSQLNAGRGSTLGPATSRRQRWYDLDLECGHAVQRTARYRHMDDRQRADEAWRRRRSAADVLPPPRRVRCERCQGIIDAAVPADGSPRAADAVPRPVVTGPPGDRTAREESNG